MKSDQRGPARGEIWLCDFDLREPGPRKGSLVLLLPQGTDTPGILALI